MIIPIIFSFPDIFVLAFFDTSAKEQDNLSSYLPKVNPVSSPIMIFHLKNSRANWIAVTQIASLTNHRKSCIYPRTGLSV